MAIGDDEAHRQAWMLFKTYRDRDLSKADIKKIHRALKKVLETYEDVIIKGGSNL